MRAASTRFGLVLETRFALRQSVRLQEGRWTLNSSSVLRNVASTANGSKEGWLPIIHDTIKCVESIHQGVRFLVCLHVNTRLDAACLLIIHQLHLLAGNQIQKDPDQSFMVNNDVVLSCLRQ